MPSVETLFGLNAEIRGDTRPLEKDIERTRKKIQELKGDIESLSKLSVNVPSLSKFGSTLDGLSNKINSFSKNTSSVSTALKKANADASNLRATFSNVEKASQGLNNKLKDVSARMADVGKGKSKFAGIGEGLGMTVTKAGVAAAAIAAVVAVVGKAAQTFAQFTQESIKAAAGFEKTKNAMTAVSGSAVIAKDELAKLDRLAATTTGLGLEVAEKGYLNLRAVGFEAERARDILEGLSKVRILSGASQEDLEGVIYNLTQIRTTGKLTGDELRETLGRLPAIAPIIEKAFGTLDTKKIAELGLSSDEFFNRLVKGLKDTQSASGGTEEAWQKLSDEWLRAKRNFGEPFLDVVTNSLKGFTSALASNQDSIKFWGEFISDAFHGLQIASKEVFPQIRKDIEAAFDLSGIPALAAFSEALVKKLTGTNISTLFREYKNLKQAQEGVALSAQAGTLAVQKYGFELANTEKRAEAAKKANEALKSTVADLTSQIAFFGQTSEEMATKQKLINAGVYDFNSALAQSAISLAKQLDGLKALEERGKKIADFQKQISETRAGALFSMAFPKATELDQFENWVRQNVASFKELKGEIEATRKVLALKLSFENTRAYIEGLKDVIQWNQQLRASFDKEIRGISEGTLDPFTEKLQAFAEQLISASNVTIKSVAKTLDGIEIFPTDFAEQSKRFVETFRTLTRQGKETGDVVNRFRDYLNNLGTVTLTTGQNVRLFTDKTLDELLKKILTLNTAITESKLKDIGKMIAEQGINLGAMAKIKKPLEELNEFFTNPANADAILKYATSLGTTIEQLKSAAIEAQKLKDGLLNIGTEAGGDATDTWLNKIKARLEDFKASLPSIRESLTENITNVLAGIGDVFSNAVRNWDGTAQGFFKSLAAGFRDLVGQIISELIRLMVIKLVANIIGSIGGGLAGGAGGAAAGPAGHAAAGIPAIGSPGLAAGLGGLSGFAPAFAGGAGFASPSITNNSTNNMTFNIPGSGNPSQTATMVKNEVIKALQREQARNK